MKNLLSHIKFALAFTLLNLTTCTVAYSADFPTSNGSQIGDHLTLTTDVHGFTPVSTNPGVAAGERCAGKYSKYSVVDTSATETIVKFYDIVEPKSVDTCPLPDRKMVTEGSLYKIPNTLYKNIQSKTTGLSYGALVVPFKFRLGSDKKLISSATVAPYIGFRLNHFQGWGFELMPVVAAGLGLVPVVSDDGKSTSTKSAFSTAVGLTLTSAKDSKFSAGVLFGKDFISKSDRLNDPAVVKPWLSLWLGVAL